VTYTELFLSFLSLLILPWFNDLLHLLISWFCIVLVNNVLASNLFTTFTIATPHKYKMWLCMLGLSKVLSEMANQQDEDFLSYSVTCMRKKFNPFSIWFLTLWLVWQIIQPLFNTCRRIQSTFHSKYTGSDRNNRQFNGQEI